MEKNKQQIFKTEKKQTADFKIDNKNRKKKKQKKNRKKMKNRNRKKTEKNRKIFISNFTDPGWYSNLQN